MLQSIKLNNFQLFKDQTINLSGINLITGTNYDSNPDEDGLYSGNGAGKSTILTAILFGLFGEVTDIKLNELIRDGSKEASVIVELTIQNENYKIIRKIPNSLQLFKGEEELKFNTSSICQMHLQSLLDTNFQHFRTYNLIDNNKGINLLDLGNISLRKSLMDFCAEQFGEIRKSLLSKKLERETYGIDKRLYKYSLSTKRLAVLETWEGDLKNDIIEADYKNEELRAEQSKANGELLSNKETLKILTENFNKNLNTIRSNIKVISESNEKCTFDADTTEIEAEQFTIESLYQSLTEDREGLKKEIEKINMQLYSINEKINQNSQDSIKVHNEISGLDMIDVGTKCDKCGSIVDVLHKEVYKKEKYIELNVLDQNQTLSYAHLKSIEAELKNKADELKELEKAITDLKKNLDDNTKLLRTLNNEKAENAKYNSLIETNTKHNETLTKDNIAIDIKIKQLDASLKPIIKAIERDNIQIASINTRTTILKKRLQQTQEYLLKLREAFKFSEYKYTAKDVLLYTEGIKTLDNFSAFYITEWLSNLSIIINNLLKGLNLSVEFSVEKDFIKLKNNGKELSYNQISGGQKKFLGVIFKIGILLQEGINSGVLLFDEGLGEIDVVNLYKLIEILKTLSFQSVIIYQNCPKEIKDVNYINIVRQNGESKIK
jgi:hypothetical protein